MPGGDGTGPRGEGPMTGMGRGFCMMEFSPNASQIRQGYMGVAGIPLREAATSDGKEHSMPGGDGTGPAGMGPMTGRAMGFCAGYAGAGFVNPLAGRGFGWSRGFGGGGRGWRNWYYATGLTGWQRAAGAGPGGGQTSPGQQLDALRAQAEYFEDVLEGIRTRIEELQAAPTED
ncbi:DUF5320 domain-containing protein [Candidatus Fermentibacteria bacterium]|nr:DUF5320 domain-containing protein [Candidatus Fermentibacteria bacterium]